MPMKLSKKNKKNIKKKVGITGKDNVEPIYEKLASKLEFGDTYYVPRIMKVLTSQEEAGILCELPASFVEIAEKLNIAREDVEAILLRCVKKGVCVIKPDGEIKLSPDMETIQDIGVINPANKDVYTEDFYELFYRMRTDKTLLSKRANIASVIRTELNNGNPVTRVVPRWKAIKNTPGVMPCEDIREILKAHDGKLSTTQCGCRKTMRSKDCAVNDGTHPDEGVCVSFGMVAEYMVEELGVGTFRSWQQVMENIDRLDQSSTYYLVDNHRDPHFICNCCGCCCGIYHLMEKTTDVDFKKDLSPSRFSCDLETEKCKGCKICATKCPFSAISMTKSGEKSVTDAEKCMGCGVCVVNCPEQARKLKITLPPEHIPETGLYYTSGAFVED